MTPQSLSAKRHGSRTRFVLETLFAFSIEMERCFESKNVRKYQGILSPASTDKSNQNYYIVNSKERNEFGYNADSGKFTSYRLDEEGGIDYRTYSVVCKR